MHIAKQKDQTALVEVDSGVSNGDRQTLDSLETLCAGLAQGGTRCLLLDMSQVRTAPSVFLATLASLQRRIRLLGGEIAVIRPANSVRKAFRVTVMDEVVGVYDDEDQAVVAVNHRLDETRKQLHTDLESPNTMTRLEAATRLARTGDLQGVELLAHFLGDEDPVVRLQSTLSLSAVGGASVVEPLLRALADEDYRVRMYAAEALGKINDRRALEPLKAAVRFDRNRNVVFKANQALEQLLTDPAFSTQ